MRLKEHLTKEMQWTIGSGLLIGFITHMYMLTNNFPSWDSLVSMYTPSRDYTYLGRPLYSLFEKLSSSYLLPSVNGFLSLLYITLAVACLVQLFEIHNKMLIVILAAVNVTFPVVTANFAYFFCSDVYMLAYFFSILAIYLTAKYRWGFLAGGLILSLSLGIYQTYISTAAITAVCLILFDILKRDAKYVWIQTTKYMGTLSIGFILYKILLAIALHIREMELNAYQGINDLNHLSIKTMILQIPNTYKNFIKELIHGSEFAQNKGKMFCVVILLFVAFILYLRMFIKEKKYSQITLCLLAVGCMLVIPLICNAGNLISTDVLYHMVMKMPYVFVSMIPILVLSIYLELMTEEHVRSKRIQLIKIAVLVATCFVVYNNYLIANVAYLNMQLRYEKALSLCNRIVDRIETTEGYYKGMPIYIYKEENTEGIYDENTSITDIFVDDISGANGDVILTTESHFTDMMREHLGFIIKRASAEQIETIQSSSEFEDMEVWPSSTSVKIINDVVVIKIYKGY